MFTKIDQQIEKFVSKINDNHIAFAWMIVTFGCLAYWCIFIA